MRKRIARLGAPEKKLLKDDSIWNTAIAKPYENRSQKKQLR